MEKVFIYFFLLHLSHDEIRYIFTLATPSSSQRLPTISINSFASIVPDSFSSINAHDNGNDDDVDDYDNNDTNFHQCNVLSLVHSVNHK